MDGGSLPVSDVANSNTAVRWFAVQVRPRAEKFVAKVLNLKGYEKFLPLYRVRHRWSDRAKEVELPLFPGYVFTRFNAMVRAPILTTPGVIRLVGNSGLPIPVEEEEIAALQAIDRAGIAAKPWPFLQVGQRVQIVAGPLCGTQGHILRIRDELRLVVSVNLLQRSVAAEIDCSWIRPADSRDRLTA